jgi:prepilin signal peptidase PulO-like enzyme (type II secretory pathway)
MVFILPLYIYNRYKTGDKLTCISAVLFALAIVIFKAASQNYLTLAFLLVTGIFLTVNVLKGIRQEENKTYLPFVPALMAGAVIFSLLN